MKIVFVHGANATPCSFAYLKDQMQGIDAIDFSYSVLDPVEKAIERLVELCDENGPVAIVSHSLGGLISVGAALRTPCIEKIVTMASPFGGSRLASFLRWTHPCQLFDDIHVNSRLVQTLASSPIPCPVLSFVTTEGAQSFILEPNDGVVTIASQKAITGPVYVEKAFNHFEVMLSKEVALEIIDFLDITEVRGFDMVRLFRQVSDMKGF